MKENNGSKWHVRGHRPRPVKRMSHRLQDHMLHLTNWRDPAWTTATLRIGREEVADLDPQSFVGRHRHAIRSSRRSYLLLDL